MNRTGLAPLPEALERLVARDDPTLEQYSASRGPIRRRPLGVIRPRHPDEVAHLCAWASTHGVALIPRGAGTGMPGGNTGPGLIVDLCQLEAPTHPSTDPDDPARLAAGAGAVAADLDARARRHGRWLPALPSSARWCTLGGMIANDAAGARTLRWGPVHDWLEAVTWVRADGAVEQLSRAQGEVQPAWVDTLVRDVTPLSPWPAVRKNSSGYALDRLVRSGLGLDLVPGSEGTLGIVVDAVIRTEPLPQHTAVALVGLPEWSALPEIAAEAGHIRASACEYFGRRLLELGGLDADPRLDGLDVTRGLALVELMGSTDEVAQGLAHLHSVAGRLGRIIATEDPAEAQALWELRHAASPTIARAAAEGLRSLQFIEDGAVPLPSVGSYAEQIEAILDAHETDGVIFGHLGDGHLHVNPLLDLRHPDAMKRARGILDEAVTLTAELGGTLAGEHGDGRLRAPLLERMWPERTMGAFRRVKDLFDPLGVLNPGVIVPLPGQDPLEGFAEL